MDNGPLVKEEIEAGAALVREFDKYAPIKAAFWLKASDDPFRYLYLASDQFNDKSFILAYREVVRLERMLRSPDLNLFRVKVISGDDPLAREAAEMQERYPDSVGTRNAGGGMFGGIYTDDVYIYPLPLPAAAH